MGAVGKSTHLGVSVGEQTTWGKLNQEKKRGKERGVATEKLSDGKLKKEAMEGRLCDMEGGKGSGCVGGG